MDEATKSAWCRENRFYLQFDQWRAATAQALAAREEARASPSATKANRRRNSRNSNANCVVRTKPWPKSQLCWCCERDCRRSFRRTRTRAHRRPGYCTSIGTPPKTVAQFIAHPTSQPQEDRHNSARKVSVFFTQTQLSCQFSIFPYLKTATYRYGIFHAKKEHSVTALAPTDHIEGECHESI